MCSAEFWKCPHCQELARRGHDLDCPSILLPDGENLEKVDALSRLATQVDGVDIPTEAEREYEGDAVFSVSADFIEELQISMRRVYGPHRRRLDRGLIQVHVDAYCEVPGSVLTENIRHVVESGAVVLIETPLGGSIPVLLKEVVWRNAFVTDDILRHPAPYRDDPIRAPNIEVQLIGEVVHLEGASNG